MKKLLAYTGLILLFTAAFLTAEQQGSEWSSPGVLDTRSTFGGQAVHGSHVYVSPRENSVTPDKTFKINGTKATGWSQTKPYWDSTSLADSIYDCDGGARIAVLNDDNAVFHGGILSQSESWEGGKVHLVQYSLRVPSGKTLTIADDAIVKFCDGVNLIIDSGATLVVGNAVFTHVADDTQGGDTNMDGNATSPKKDAYKLTVNGNVRPVSNPYIYYLTPTSAAKLYAMTTSNCTSDRSIYFLGATVSLTTTPILNWPEEENVVTWSSTPSTTITKDAKDRFAATLTMPASNLTVTATVTKQKFNITTVNCSVDATPQTPDAIATLTATIPAGYQAEDFIFEWSSEPAVTITPNKNDHTKATFTMPHSAITVTCTLKQIIFHITTKDSTADVAKASPDTLVTLTATIPEGEPPEEYIVEWSSEPAVTITPNADDHTKATFMMPDKDIAVTCKVTRKTYKLTIVNGYVMQNGKKLSEVMLQKYGTVTINATLLEGVPVEDYLIDWSIVPHDAYFVADAKNKASVSYTMPNHDVTVSIDAREIFLVTTRDCRIAKKEYIEVIGGYKEVESYYDTDKVKSGALVTMTAIIPANQPAEEYNIEWSSEPAVTFKNISHTRATFTMPNEHIHVTCTVTRKTYKLNIVNGYVLQDEQKLTEIMLPMDEGINIQADFAEGVSVAWSIDPEEADFAENFYDKDEIFYMMPNHDVTITANQMFIITTEKCNADVEKATSDTLVTLVATIPDGEPPEDYIVEWSSEPPVTITPNADEHTKATFNMPDEDIAVTCTLRQMFYIMTDENSTADLEKCLPDTNVTLTAIIPEDQPPEEYTVEWSSEPEVTISPDSDDHTKATFKMPDEAITVTCTVTRKTYKLTIINIVAVIDGEEYTDLLDIEKLRDVIDDLKFTEKNTDYYYAKGDVIDIESIQYNIKDWTRMIGWTTDEEYMNLIADSDYYSTTFTMPNTPLTLTANYETMPYLPEDTDKSKDINLNEYLPAKDAMQSHSLNGDLCTINEENGKTAYLPNENVLAGEDGDYIRRSVKPAVYAEGSTIEVMFEIKNPVDFESLAILENIPDDWRWYIKYKNADDEDCTFGSSGAVIFDVAKTTQGVAWTISDTTGETIYHINKDDGVPQSITFYITPEVDADLTDDILLNSSDAVGNIGNSYLDVIPADSPLNRVTPHWADTNKDLLLTQEEILAGRQDLITIILNGGKYVWDGEKFIPYPPLEATRAGEYEEEFEITRQLSSTDFDLGGQVSVTLDLSSLAMSQIVSLKEKLPKGWKVVKDGGGKVAKDGSFILFDFDLMDAKPNSVTYTLQAPTLFAEQEYKITSTFCKAMDSGYNMDVRIPDTILRWSNPKPSMTVHTSSQLAQWRVNDGDWLESGAHLSVAAESAVSIQLKLPDANVIFDTWLPLDDTTSVATPKAESLNMTMPNHDVVLKARLVSPRELVISVGWNFLCKTVEMAETEEFNEQTVCFIDQGLYKKTTLQNLPLGTVFWFFSRKKSTVTLRPEAVRTPSNYRPARLQNGWQGIGSPDARLRCLVKPDDADSILCWKNGKWIPFDSQNGKVPLSAEQGYFLFK